MFQHISQGRSVHVSHISPANTLKKRKIKKSYFRGSVALHTLQHSRTDQIIIKHLQPAHVSHLVQAYVPRLFAQAQLEDTI
jgi:hypothetical protein